MQTSQIFIYVDPAIQHWEFFLGNQSRCGHRGATEECVAGKTFMSENQEQRTKCTRVVNLLNKLWYIQMWATY